LTSIDGVGPAASIPVCIQVRTALVRRQHSRKRGSASRRTGSLAAKDA
jgi:hypothetical protein